MSFRITTNGMMRNYRTNLYDNNKKLNDAMTTVETGRKFNKYAEDPGAASMAFQLRRNFWRAGDQIDNTNYVISKFQTAWNAVDEIVDGTDENPGLSGITATLRGLNDPIGNGRTALGRDLLSTANSIMQMMNTRYGDEYVFAGADGLNAPFSQDKDGNLLFRGKKVDDYGTAALPAPSEATYVDIGLGMEGDASGVEPATAFNSALSGLDILGYGKDENGDPNNIVSIMKELGTLFSSCNQDTGAYEAYSYNGKSYTAKEAEDRAFLLADKLDKAISYVQEQHVALDGKSHYLQENKKVLEDSQYTLNEQITDIEQMDMAESAMEMMWAQYCYNAALQIGTRVLSQSLLDYMR